MIMERLTQAEKQRRSDSLAMEIKKESIVLINQLPGFLTKDNLDFVVSIMDNINRLTDKSLFDRAEKLGIRDFFSSWRLLFLPFWKLTFGWDSAYGEGFTWKDFLSTLLERKENRIKKCVDLDKPIGVEFYDDFHVLMALVSLVKED